MKISKLVLYIFFIIVSLFLLTVIIYIGLNYQVEISVFWEEILKASLNLLLLGIIGLLAKELFNAYTKQKMSEEEMRTRRIEALNKLTEGYWGIKKALHLIMAHKSAKSYKEQMHLIIDQRLKLQQLNNEVQGGLYEFGQDEKIANALKDFDDQINPLVDEWTEAHIDLSWQQTKDEKSPPERKKVPQMIDELESLNKVWDCIDLIHTPYQVAAKHMRNDLIRFGS